MTFLESLVLFNLWSLPLRPAETPSSVVNYQRTNAGDLALYKTASYAWKSDTLLEETDIFPGQSRADARTLWRLDSRGRVRGMEVIALEDSTRDTKSRFVYANDTLRLIETTFSFGKDSTIFRYAAGKLVEQVLTYEGELYKRRYVYTYAGDTITHMTVHWGDRIEAEDDFTYVDGRVIRLTGVHPASAEYSWKEDFAYAGGHLVREDSYTGAGTLAGFVTYEYAGGSAVRPQPAAARAAPGKRGFDALGRAAITRAGVRLF